MNDQEILEALKKSVAMPPVLCMNERSVIFVDYADGHGEAKTQVNNWFHCPCCSSIVGERRIVCERIIDQRKKPYCEKCGQKMKWTAGMEEERKLITVNAPDTEYTVLAKQIAGERYVHIGGVFGNELLCRKRFEEKVRNREIFHGVDISTAVLAKREKMTLTEEWEVVGNVALEM